MNTEAFNEILRDALDDHKFMDNLGIIYRSNQQRYTKFFRAVQPSNTIEEFKANFGSYSFASYHRRIIETAIQRNIPHVTKQSRQSYKEKRNDILMIIVTEYQANKALTDGTSDDIRERQIILQIAELTAELKQISDKKNIGEMPVDL